MHQQLRGYQFINTRTHSIKGNKNGAGTARGSSAPAVLLEAGRAPGACGHLAFDQIHPPVVLQGVHPVSLLKDLEKLIKRRKMENRELMRNPLSGWEGRNIRIDTHVLNSFVISAPVEVKDARADEELWNAYLDFEISVVDWLFKYGDEMGTDIQSIVRHEDERFLHIHAFGIPENHPRLDAKASHPGYVAKKTAQEGHEYGDYKRAMEAFQDRFHREVSARHGLLRGDSRRTKMAYTEWTGCERELHVMTDESEARHRDAGGFEMPVKFPIAIPADPYDRRTDDAEESGMQGQIAVVVPGHRSDGRPGEASSETKIVMMPDWFYDNEKPLDTSGGDMFEH